MNNIPVTPGALCIIRRGPKTGTSLTAIQLAEEGEVEALIAKKLGVPDVVLVDKRIWRTDKEIDWVQMYGGMKISIPYEAESNLLPIPPLADPLDVKQEEEKPCTA